MTFCFVDICRDLVICVDALGVFFNNYHTRVFSLCVFGLFIYAIASIVLQYSGLTGFRSEKETGLLLS